MLEATVTPKPYEAIRDSVNTTVAGLLGETVAAKNGAGLQHEEAEQLTGILKAFGFESNLLIRSFGIPTITVSDIITWGPGKLGQIVNDLEDAGGVPLVGS